MIPNILFPALSGVVILILAFVSFAINRKSKEIDRRTGMHVDYIESLVMQYELDMKSMSEYNSVISRTQELFYSGKTDELRKYCDEVMVPLCKKYERDDAVLRGLSNITDTAIRGIIYDQALKLKHSGLNLSVDISDISEMAMYLMDFSNILGVFVDNAIEEAQKSQEKYVFAGMYQDENGTVLRIENSCASVPHINDIYDYGYSEKGRNRGTGLFGVRKKTDKYINVGHRTFYDNDKNLFVQEMRVSNVVAAVQN